MSELSYKTVIQTGVSEFRDRGSKFLGFVFPMNAASELKTYLQPLKEQHPKAVHHCFAYRMGTDGTQFRANDDGEPSGSAGKPILGQIDSLGLTNILVVVVRYFGGTLLGVPGLINAYKTAAAEALAQCTIVVKPIEALYKLSFDYTIMNEVITVLKKFDAQIFKQQMELFCVYEVGIPLINEQEALDRLQAIYGLEISTFTGKVP